MTEEKTGALSRAGSGAMAFFLWAFTASLGLLEIVIIREMVLRVYARFWAGDGGYGQSYWGGVAVGNWLAFILALVWIALVIGGGEYQYKNVGKSSSWRLFGRTIDVQLSILVLALFI
mgnify:CR=1 FL=1